MKGDAARRGRYDLQDRLVDFAARVSDVVEALPSTRTGNHVAGQLIRCGTSPAANHAEAQGAESRSDFLHKMRIALKELRETRVWLLLTQRKGLVRPPRKLDALLRECDEIIAIFSSSVRTATAAGRREQAASASERHKAPASEG